MTDTQWNGEPCAARQITATVADNTAFPMYWARPFVGMRRKAVEVEYGGETFYLDDEAGEGWHKVTHGGSPWLTHSSLTIEPDSVEPRADAPDQIRFARRFVAIIPDQPDIHGVQFPSGRIIADTETGLTAFLTADVITADYAGAVIHWADEENTDGR
ncbi:hypothetical protein [Streptomyces sp. NBC_00996]|uniref:hypothetical protein n=1 Tax=Streptomyces sp. NBC_00996 TaxID=2903710 RepID=UPI003863C563|nr:hypothetical protein OG390_17350 [Streptomyces sp. NBC_00996]